VWSTEEDNELKRIILRDGPGNWEDKSKELNSRRTHRTVLQHALQAVRHPLLSCWTLRSSLSVRRVAWMAAVVGRAVRTAQAVASRWGRLSGERPSSRRTTAQPAKKRAVGPGAHVST
jgi:hypothetical protein